METRDEREWTTGELAASAGITVRALHHYDRIGLLVPAERSTGGHRRYAAAGVERLYRIVALRRLGFPLAEIKAMLDADHGQLTATVRRQLGAVDQELELRGQIRDRLAGMLAQLEGDRRLSADQLIEAMKEISMTVRIDRVYTRIGDAGETELADGIRVAKTDPKLEAGELEELNAQIGVVIATSEASEHYGAWLAQIQNDLFDVGAELARGDAAGESCATLVNDEYVAWLEDRIDEVNRGLEPLESFVLPGGSTLAAQLHLCRTVCRRAERRVLASGHVSSEVARYLNRLSDLLFVLARAVAEREEVWKPGRREGTRSRT